MKTKLYTKYIELQMHRRRANLYIASERWLQTADWFSRFLSTAMSGQKGPQSSSWA